MHIYFKRSIKFLAATLFTSILLFNYPKTVSHAVFDNGTGTAGDPFQISTPAHLDTVRDYLGSAHSDKYFVLMNDVDLNVSPYNTGAGWVPIGTGTSTTRFYGHFDGNGFAIQNLFINSSTTYLGVFGSAIGTITNLGVENISLTGSNTGSAVYIGGIVGRNYGTIDNSYVTGILAPSGWVTGGMAGENVNGGSITSSYSTVTVNTSSLRSGGLVGQNFGEIDLSYATGNVTSPTNQIGGLVGISFTSGSISNSYSTGAVTGDTSVGGLIGANERPISNSYATGNVTSAQGAGGLAGSNSSTITNCYAVGNTNSTGGWYGGGLVGSNSAGGVISYSYSIGAVTSIYSGGGLVGTNNGSVSNSYWNTETSGFSTSNGGTGKSTIQMKDQATYVGWDFTNLWFIEGANNNGYPYFNYQGYALPTYTLTYSANTNGSLSGTTSQVVIHGNNGSAVTAVPSSHYHFTQWSDSSTSNPRTDTSVSSDITVAASFAIDSYTFDYSANTNGTLSGTTNQTVNYGNDGSTVTAIPDAHYHFVQWDDSSTDNPRTDLNASTNITVIASFAIDTYAFDYTAGTNGTLTGTSSQTVDYGNDGTTVTAVPDANYHFVQWSDTSTDNPRTDLNASADIDVEASFTINTFSLIYTSGIGGNITGNASQTIGYGSNGSAVTAVASNGYHFVSWSDGSVSNPRTDTNVDANVEVAAVFAANPVPTGTAPLDETIIVRLTPVVPVETDENDDELGFEYDLETDDLNVEVTPKASDDPNFYITALSIINDQTILSEFKVKIIDIEGLPIADLELTIDEISQSTTTNADGIATFENLATGLYHIVLMYDGDDYNREIYVEAPSEKTEYVEIEIVTIQLDKTTNYTFLYVLGIVTLGSAGYFVTKKK